MVEYKEGSGQSDDGGMMAGHDFPPQPTPFVGREEEIASLQGYLADPTCRLLTLVGPGGIGKTRLALEVARSLAFADGVRFVDLQPVNTSEVLINAIANTLGLLLSGPEGPRRQLLSYLSTHEMLLLLDNFEQLLDCVDLLADILTIAPNIKLLVTSREALNLQEEWLWQVGGLQVPDHPAVTNIGSYSAVQLFAERVRRTRQDFALTGQEASVTHICQLVEGLPLALELAAGWTKALSCAEIVDEIQRGLDFLKTNKRNMPQRHQSMQAVFDHSWRLLTESERQAFSQLSVFRGGFRREAAEQVAGADLSTLAGLMDKSFLRVSAGGRYEIHELMRQYGDEHLKATPDAKRETQHRHCAYYAAFLYQRQVTLRGPQQARALDEIEAELDNIRATWEWAVEHGMADEIRQSMHSLYVFCHIRAHAPECERLFDLAIHHFNHEDSAILAYLLLVRITLRLFNGKDFDHDQFLRGIRLAYTFWTEDEIAIPLRAHLWVRDELMQRELYNILQYEQLCRDFIKIFRVHAQPWGIAYLLFCLGDMYHSLGQNDEAEKYFRQSMNNFLEMGDRWASAWSSMGLAWVMEASERYHEALQWWVLHQEVCVEVGDRGGLVYVLANKAKLNWKLQDNHAAKFYIAQAINAHLESGSQFIHLEAVLRSLIAVFVSENRHERAAELSSFLRQQADSASAQGVMGGVQQVLDSIAQKLPSNVYRLALERGKALHLRTILEQLSNELAEYALPASSPSALTEREMEVLRLTAAGHSNRQIARDLVLTLNTVKSHIHHIYGKLGVSSRTQAVARARELNLL
jgi:predicted ATPase/DNA-binding CsgD family transcriptional regulator